MKIQKFVLIALSIVLLHTCVIKEELPPNPIANFEIEAIEKGKVTFRNTSQNASHYLWDFGDDNTSNQITPTHTYTREGTYKIILTSHGFGNDTISKQIPIILYQPPTDILLSNDTILENQPTDILVGTFSTIDPDIGDVHSYSLVAGIGDADNSSFIIDGEELKSNEVFDYEVKNIYSIRVKSEDQNGKNIEKSFTIRVTDDNESPTDILLSNDTILENQSIGTLIGVFSTVEPNVGDIHTYSLVAGMGDADNSSFIISGEELKSNEIFDYEAKNIYSIRVKSEDQDGGNIEKIFIIMVKNVAAGWKLATNSAAWPARSRHASVVFDNKIWILGGQSTSTAGSEVYLNDVWYSNDGVNWTEATSSANWTEGVDHTSIAFDNGSGDKIWVLGGSNLPSIFKNDIWYSDNGINWDEITTSLIRWIKRDSHTSVVFDDGSGDKIWVLGGDDGSNGFNDVWHSSNGINWTEVTSSAPWSKRFSHTSVVFDNKIWILGGGQYSSTGEVHLNDVWYSRDGANWTEATNSAPWDERGAHASVVFDNKIWVLGGLTNSVGTGQSDVWYSSNGMNWIEATNSAPWGERSAHASVVFNNRIWILGGFSYSTFGVKNDVWYYEE